MFIDRKIITNEISGNLKNIELFISALNNSSMDSRAWIIEGPKGIGKSSLIKLISCIILNIDKKPSLLNNDNILNPDLFILQKEDEKKYIPVEKIRSLKIFFSKTSFGGLARIAIIDAINDLNNYGHNAILKVIEEPPQKSFIFIVNHLNTEIPKTIKSRCKTFNLRELTEKEVFYFLSKKVNNSDKDLVKVYSIISNGSIGNAIDYFNNNAADVYKNICIYLKNFNSFDDKAISSFIDKINNNKNKKNLILIFFKLLQFFITKVIKTKVSIIQSYCDTNEELAINNFSKKISLNNLFSLKDKINNYYYNFDLLNTDLHSTLYSLLIEIHKNILKSNNET